MRKFLLTVLSSLLVMCYVHSQTVIFDPATYTGTLKPGMSVVNVDGTAYLQVVLDGWNSTIDIPGVTSVIGTQITGYVRYAQGSSTIQSGLSLANLGSIVQVMDTINKVPASWNPSEMVNATTTIESRPAVNAFTYFKKPLTQEMANVHQIQFIGQEDQTWNSVIGDTMWVGRISTIIDTILFDPATIDPSTLPSGSEIVMLDGKKYLKVQVDGWSSYIDIPSFTVGDYDRWTFDAKYESGTSGYAATDVNLGVNATYSGSNYFYASKMPAPVTLSPIIGNATPYTTINQLQVFVQETTNWSSIYGAYVYIGVISVYKDIPVQAVAPETGIIKCFEDQTITLDGADQEAIWDTVPKYSIHNLAIGNLADTLDSGGYFQIAADDSYLYIYANITDNDPVQLGSSTQPWMNDGIEIFVDAQNRRYVGGQRIEGQQHQFRCNFGSVSPLVGDNGMPSFFGYNDLTNIQFAQGLNATGYTIELKMPLVTLFRTHTNTDQDAMQLVADRAAGHKIAFEVSILDASSEDMRKSILNWSNNTGNDVAYRSNEWYGELAFADDTNYISVIAPAVADTFYLPSNVNVTWTSGFEDKVDLALYNDETFVQSIAENVDNTGSYLWTPSATLPNSSQYQIKISKSSDSQIYDYSGLFTLIGQNDTILFDPARLDPASLPVGSSIVNEGGKKYLKVQVDYWNSYINIPSFTVKDYDHCIFEIKYEKGTSEFNASDVTIGVNGFDIYNYLSASIQPAPTSFAMVTGLVTPNSKVNVLQLFGLETSNSNPIGGAYIYIGEIKVFKKIMVQAEAPEVGNIQSFTNQAITLDGTDQEPVWNTAPKYNINKLAIGSVSDSLDTGGYYKLISDDSSLYVFVNVTDNDPIAMTEFASQPWFNDGIEIFVDAQNRRYVDGMRIEGEQHQFRCNYGKTGSLFGGTGMPNFFGYDDTTAIRFAQNTLSSGYAIELRIPLITLFRTQNNTNLQAKALVDSMEAGHKMAFEISILDAIAIDTRKSIVNWSNNTGLDVAYTSNEWYGELTFLGKDNSIGLTTPVVNDTFCLASEVAITWAAGFSDSVNLYLYKGEVLLDTIVERTENDGIYNWVSELNLTSSDQYKIKVTKSIDQQILAYSEPFCMIGLVAEPQQPNGDTSICMGVNTSAYFTNKVVDAQDYIWSLLPLTAGTISGTDTLATVSWSNNFTGVAKIRATAKNSCFVGQASDSLVVKINALPLVDLGPDTVINNTQSVLLDAGAGFKQYQWSSGETSQTLNVLGDDLGVGHHQLSVLVTSNEECQSSDTIQITVEKLSGVEEDQFSFKAYPNPANQVIRFEAVDVIESIAILDVTGKTVLFEKGLNQNVIEVNIASLQNGVYLVSITDLNQNTKVVRITKY